MNLTHDYLVEGFLHGIVYELCQFWSELPLRLQEQMQSIVGVGNGLRRNPLLRRILEEEFGMPLAVPVATEEAALGAAIIAGVGIGSYSDYLSHDRPIVYENE